MSIEELCTRLRSDDRELIELDFDAYEVDSVSVAQLADALAQNTTLKALRFYWCSIRAGGVSALAKALKTNDTLTVLSLAACVDDDKSVVPLAAALRENCGLKHLNLSRCDFESKGAAEIVCALEKNNSLKSLYLCGSRSLNADFFEACNTAFDKNATLKVLDLEGNSCDDLGAASFAAFLQTNQSLQQLVFPWPLANVALVADALSKNRGLKFADVRGLMINDKTRETVICALKMNQTIETLILMAGTKNVKSVTSLVAESTSLEHLDLSRSQMDAQGVEALCDGLKKSKTLTALHLPYCGDTGAVSVASVLLENKNLNYLDLWGCDIGDVGAKAIMDALMTNTSLEMLLLAQNQIGSEGFNHIAAALPKNRTLKYLHLMGNNVGCAEMESLLKSLKDSNPELKVCFNWSDRPRSPFTIGQ